MLYVNILAAVAGVALHVVYFNRFEHHMYGTRYLQAFLVTFVTGVVYLVRANNASIAQAITTITAPTFSFLGGLLCSLIVYRAFLHPLNKFPGPFMARITNLWYSAHVAGHAQAPERMLKLHEKYGEFVRIGSSDLSITHPEGPKVLYGLGSKCTKSSWYDQDAPLTSMHTSRSRAMHDRRRRIWSPAFSDKALRGYEERIKVYGETLTEQLTKSSGAPVNVAKWFNFYSFDVMGDLAFGESFGMLKSGKEHWAVKLLNEGMEPFHLMLPPWFFRVIAAIPGLTAGYWKFIGYCSQQLDNRMNRKVEIPDIMSVLLEPYANKDKPTGLDLRYLQGDSRLIIVAGSDTTAATLTHVFYHLSKDPSRVDKLRKELAPYVSPNGDVNHRDVQDLPYLNGCINEALRLNPPVPTAIQRLTPPEGIQIGDTTIPGHMTVWAPQYVISRSEAVYQDAYSFLPERWFDNSTMIKEKTAFAPFSVGVYGCIGKPLALIEIRTIITKLVTKFDIAFAPGEDGSTLMNKTRDHFTLGLADLNLTFTDRSK